MDRKSELMSPLTRAVKPAAGESRVSGKANDRRNAQKAAASIRELPQSIPTNSGIECERVARRRHSSELVPAIRRGHHLSPQQLPPQDNSPGANDGRSSVRLKLLRSRTRGALAAWGLAAPGGAVRFLEA